MNKQSSPENVSDAANPVQLRIADVPGLAAVEPLWTALYRHQAAHGMQVCVPSNGFALWRDGLRTVLGRFVTVWIAETQGEAVGFLCGRERVLPAYLGGGSVGYISEVFVGETHRGRGIGAQLMAAATKFYREKNIRRMELQVVAGNPDALDFYLKLGWREELSQMVRMIE